jgi:SMC interacting uncharacterized protein involved in chromosome segregation
MTWICPYCGQENWNEDRIAFKEPPCTRCKKERITPEQLRENLNKERKELLKDLKLCRPDVSMLREEIEDLETDLAEAKCRLMETLEERKPYVQRIKEIDSMVIHTQAERVIPKDQRKLDLGPVAQ